MKKKTVFTLNGRVYSDVSFVNSKLFYYPAYYVYKKVFCASSNCASTWVKVELFIFALTSTTCVISLSSFSLS